MEDLKPCPFCGGKGSLDHHADSHIYVIVCTECEAEGSWTDSEEKAIANWNKRK